MLNTITALLGQIDLLGAFSARQTATFENLRIEVKDVGPLKFPLSIRKARALIKRARPARFGWRDETHLDNRVRDVWEIPKSAIKIDKRSFNKTFNPVLEKLKERLGLSGQARLSAQLHNLMVYEKSQFFLPHQDSEKVDGMIATLVVVLPSVYRGGSLVIDHQGEKKTYPSSSTPSDKLTFIAFYTDCQHEVRPVTDGYRVVLTYNLLLQGDYLEADIPASKETAKALENALSGYFQQPPTESAWHSNRYPPNRFVYLLDHEYTPKGLSWRALKSADRTRARMLLEAAGRLDLEIYLTLADIQETWYAEDSWGYDSRHSRYWEDDDDKEEENEDDLELIDLIEDSTLLRHWLDREDKPAKLPDLSVGSDSICWTRATNDFQPFESEYEGWTGNAGNTLDRWYHRAAIIAWRKADHFSMILEFSPSKAIAGLHKLNRKKSGPLETRQRVSDMLPAWSGLESGAKPTAFNQVLQIANRLADAALAESLIKPLGVGALQLKTLESLVGLLETYGAPWCIKVLQSWYCNTDYQGMEQPIDSLYGLVQKLKSISAEQTVVLSTWMLNHQFNLRKQSHLRKLKTDTPGQLREKTASLVKDIQELLSVSLLTGDQDIHDQTLDHLKQHPALYPINELAGLLMHFHKRYRKSVTAGWGHTAFRQFVTEGLRTKVESGSRDPNDWSIRDDNRCQCQDCQMLNRFLNSNSHQRIVWPLAQQRRRHIHNIIDSMRLPVTHQTERTGSPHKLILTKQKALFAEDNACFEKSKTLLETLENDPVYR